MEDSPSVRKQLDEKFRVSVSIDQVPEGVHEKADSTDLHPVNFRVFDDGKQYTGINGSDVLRFFEARVHAAQVWIAADSYEQATQKITPNLVVDPQKISDKDKKEKITQLNKLLERFKSNISKKNSKFLKALEKYQKAFRKYQEDPSNKDNKENFKKKFKILNQGLNGMLGWYVTHVTEIVCSSTKAKHSDVVKKLNRLVAHRASNAQRPIQMHQYPVAGSVVNDAHFPVGLLTPEQSLILEQKGFESPADRRRTGSSKIRGENQIGQANFLKTELRMGDELLFQGFRHASHSVLLIQDEAVRHFYSLQNLKQTIAAMIREKFKENEKLKERGKGTSEEGTAEEGTMEESIAKEESEGGIIELPINFLSLLSPIYQERLDPMKQWRQVNDMRSICNMVNDRVIEVVIDGKRHQVKPHINYMNLGVNAARGLRDPYLEAQINYRGISNIVLDFIQHTDEELKSVEKIPSDIVDWIEKLKKQDFYKKFKKDLEAFNNSKEKGKLLCAQYAKIEALNEQIFYMQYCAEEDNEFEVESTEGNKDRVIKAVIADLKRERSAVMEEITRLEAERHSIYVGFYGTKAVGGIGIYGLRWLLGENKFGFKDFFRENKGDLESALGKREDGEDGEDRKDENDQKLIEQWKIFLDGFKAYFDHPRGVRQFLSTILPGFLSRLIGVRPYQKEGNEDPNYHFQIRMLMLAYNMGHTVEWCCKSGEDRTGILNDFLNAFALYSKLDNEHHVPRYGNDDDLKKFLEIFKVVSNCSPQKWSNDENSPGERGKKITASDIGFLTEELKILQTNEKAMGKLEQTISRLVKDRRKLYMSFVEDQQETSEEEKSKNDNDAGDSEERVLEEKKREDTKKEVEKALHNLMASHHEERAPMETNKEMERGNDSFRRNRDICFEKFQAASEAMSHSGGWRFWRLISWIWRSSKPRPVSDGEATSHESTLSVKKGTSRTSSSGSGSQGGSGETSLQRPKRLSFSGEQTQTSAVNSKGSNSSNNQPDETDEPNSNQRKKSKDKPKG